MEPSERREQRRAGVRRLLLATTVGLAAQVPLFGFFDSQTRGPSVATLCGPELGAWIETSDLALLETFAAWRAAHCAPSRSPLRVTAVRITREEEPEPELPEDMQVVEVPDQPEPDQPEPVDTRYVSTKTTRTEKETRSERSAPPQRAAAGKANVREVSEVQSPDSQSAEETVTSEEAAELKLADAAAELPEDRSGERPAKSVVERGQEPKLLLPPTSDRAALANLQALAGDFTSSDHLPDVDRDRSTVLNANRYKHADFFLRVKRAVERHWNPAQVYRTRDPTGQVYGVKDRYTVLRITLSEEGRLISMLTTRDSGLDFMDDEARQAFRRAQPFPNPPEGLLDPKNEIVFEFGFFFEITGGRHRFNWRRL